MFDVLAPAHSHFGSSWQTLQDICPTTMCDEIFLPIPVCLAFCVGPRWQWEIIIGFGWVWELKAGKWHKTWAQHCLLKRWWPWWRETYKGSGLWRKKWYCVNKGWRTLSSWTMLPLLGMITTMCSGPKKGLFFFAAPLCELYIHRSPIRQRQLGWTDTEAPAAAQIKLVPCVLLATWVLL